MCLRDGSSPHARLGLLIGGKIAGNLLATRAAISYEVILQDVVPGAADEGAAAIGTVGRLSLIVRNVSHIAVFNPF